MEEVNSNIGTAILMRFNDATRMHHLEIRRIITATSHGFVAPTAATYLEATCSSLDRLSPTSEAHVIEAVVTLLSALIPLLPPEILIDKESTNQSVSTAVARVLQFDTRNLTENAALLGIECISQLLTVILTSHMDSAWCHISYLFELFLGFATTLINDVRKRSFVAIAEVMQSFQGTTNLVPASEALVNLFERWWLPLLGENAPIVLSNTAPRLGSEPYFCLDAVKRCVALMPTEFRLTMLNYFKTMLEVVSLSRRITIGVELCLERFFLHPSAHKDVPPHLLLHLVCLISESVTKAGAYDREGTTTASILKNGMSAVYSSNREICVIKLPLVFDALKVVMWKPADEVDQGFLEADIDAAAQAFQHLIHACVDEGLISQGLDQMNTSASSKCEPQELTTIEKLCATIQSLLGYHSSGAHAHSMDCAFGVVSTMFDKLGACSCNFMRGSLESLVYMHKLGESFPYRKQATLLIGRLVTKIFWVHHVFIRAVLTRKELKGLLTECRDHQKHNRLREPHLKMNWGSTAPIRSTLFAKVATRRAVESTEKMTKKIRL